MSHTIHGPYLEDLLLWRALGHVPSGRYLDVGAREPVRDSVSHLFHAHGWQGTHVVYETQYMSPLGTARPDDVLIPGDGSVSLDTLLAADSAPVHWLRLAAPRSHEDLLRTWRQASARPWIVLLSRHSDSGHLIPTAPSLATAASAAADTLLQEKGYSAIYQDGANTYYLHESQAAQLAPAFARPPGPQDDFQLPDTHWLVRGWPERLESQDHILQALRRELAQATVQAQRQEVRLRDGEAAIAHLALLQGSRSWRLLAPLRWLAWQRHLLKQHGLAGRLRALTHKVAHRREQRRKAKAWANADAAMHRHSPREQSFYQALTQSPANPHKAD